MCIFPSTSWQRGWVHFRMLMKGLPDGESQPGRRVWGEEGQDLGHPGLCDLGQARAPLPAAVASPVEG